MVIHAESAAGDSCVCQFSEGDRIGHILASSTSAGPTCVGPSRSSRWTGVGSPGDGLSPVRRSASPGPLGVLLQVGYLGFSGMYAESDKIGKAGARRLISVELAALLGVG